MILSKIVQISQMQLMSCHNWHRDYWARNKIILLGGEVLESKTPSHWMMAFFSSICLRKSLQNSKKNLNDARCEVSEFRFIN